MAEFEALDKIYREHKLFAELIRQHIVGKQENILIENDPELFAQYNKGFVGMVIDYEKKRMIVTPTTDPQMKRQEAGELLKIAEEKKS
mgnify:CR=1 FL=1